TSYGYDRSAVIRPQTTTPVRSNPQTTCDGTSGKITITKKFVTAQAAQIVTAVVCCSSVKVYWHRWCYGWGVVALR
ncbi:MAG: hypothetical protein ACREBU_23500, partial [Nitrososphaera sp.]